MNFQNKLIEGINLKKKEEYNCKYCGTKMNKFDYELNNGYCGKCRDLMDIKRTLDHYKELKK